MSVRENDEVLESWKEISDYLNRDVKTCRRWELELDLPIRRLDDTPKARVFASKVELDFWLKDKLNNREISTTKYLRIIKQKPKTLWIALSAVLLLILLSVVLIRNIPLINFISPAPKKPHLAVLPVKNYTGDESLEYLRDALTNLITSDLYQSKYIRVLTMERMNKILEDMNKLQVDSYTTDDLKKIASLEGITHFLTGSVTKLGETIRIDVSIQKTRSWETIWADQIEGNFDDMFAMVDVLTKTLKPQLNLTDEQIADDFYETIENVTTPNDRALQFYIQAKKAMIKTDWQLAIGLFQRAIALDPDFAMAYRWLSGVFNVLALETQEKAYWEKLEENSKKAYDAAQRRPPSKRERLIIEGLNGGGAEEMEAFKKLLELYPDDDYANSRLGARYVQGEKYEWAERHLKRVVHFTNNYLSYIWLGRIYLEQGRYKEAEDLFELGMMRFPNNWAFYQLMARLHALQQEFDEALLWCDKGFEIEPFQFRDSLIRGDVLFFKGDFKAAEEEYRNCQSSENNQTRIKAAINLAFLYKTQGRFEDVIIQARTAKQYLEKDRNGDFDPINTELALLTAKRGNIQDAFKLQKEVVDFASRFKLEGEIFASKRQWSEVEAVLLQLEQEVQISYDDEFRSYLIQNDIEPPKSKKLRRALLGLKARLFLEKGDYIQANEIVELAKSLYCGLNLIPADLIELSGIAYYKLGDLESAEKQYEWISRMTFNRKEFGNIYVKSHYMLGRIFEEKGNKRKATKYYEKFLDFWKDADPGSPEIENVRSRLIVLQ